MATRLIVATLTLLLCFVAISWAAPPWLENELSEPEVALEQRARALDRLVVLAGKTASSAGGKTASSAGGKTASSTSGKASGKVSSGASGSASAHAEVTGSGATRRAMHTAVKAAAPENPSHHAEHHVSEAHMKHRVHKQNDLREEYREEREKAIDELDETQRFRNTIVVSLALIVVLSLLFEAAAKSMLSTKDPYLRPILHVVFKELTVLGFLSLLVFVTVHTGIPQQWSEVIFGTPSELIHMFHHVHMLVFFIMISYVVIVMVILRRTRSTSADWRNCENVIQKNLCFSASMPSARKSLDATPRQHPLTFGEEYATLRDAFVHPRQPTQLNVPVTFDFGEYLSSALAETYANIAEIGVSTWSFVLCLLVIVRMYMMIKDEGLKLIIFVGVGWLFVAAGLFVQLKLRVILFQLTGLRKPSYSAFGYKLFGLDIEAVEIQGDMWRVRDGYVFSKRTELASRPDPPYLRAGVGQDLETFRKVHPDRIPNKHEQLFWFQRNGPEFLVEAIRSMLFIQAIFVACVLFRFRDDIGHYDGLSIVGLAIPPIITVWYIGPEVILNLVVASSTEMLRRRELIEEVNVSQKRKAAQIKRKLCKALKSHATQLHHREHKDPDNVLTPISTIVKRSESDSRCEHKTESELRKLFERYDQGTGRITKHDLEILLATQGTQVAPLELNNMLKLVFDSLDFQGFCDFVRVFENNQFDAEILSQADINALYCNFQYRVKHGMNGEVDAHEVYEQLHDLASPIPVEAVSKCVNALTSDDDSQDVARWIARAVESGFIDHATFTKLLTRPRYEGEHHEEVEDIDGM